MDRLTLWIVQEVAAWAYLTPEGTWSRRICDAQIWRDLAAAERAAIGVGHREDTVYTVRLTAEVQAMRKISPPA